MNLTEAQITAIIAASSVISGSLITGLWSFISTRLSTRKEDQRRHEDLNRSTARERIDKLYEPLARIMGSSPDGEFYLDDSDRAKIQKLVSTNDIYASPDLLRVYYSFLDAYRNQAYEMHSIEWHLYCLAVDEYDQLKEILGYGSILRKQSLLKKVTTSLYRSLALWERLRRYIRRKCRKHSNVP